MGIPYTHHGYMLKKAYTHHGYSLPISYTHHGYYKYYILREVSDKKKSFRKKFFRFAQKKKFSPKKISFGETREEKKFPQVNTEEERQKKNPVISLGVH